MVKCLVNLNMIMNFTKQPTSVKGKEAQSEPWVLGSAGYKTRHCN